MDADSFQRAERLFHEAMAQTPASRSVFVAQAAGGDERLALRVRRLLHRAEGASATPTVCVDHSTVLDREASHGDQWLIGATIGRFRIIEVLGEGGFGCVYRAEQHEPIRRGVALKILRSGMDSQQVIARFESERQALALMEHPNIARVYDAGRTGPELGSRPYFAMELVGGGGEASTAVPITVYCDERQLDIEARLELFITVCQAVQHAHQKGIIHRDLKPSNILVSEVDGMATPKVIDFGIAKATQTTNRLSDRTLVTEAQQLLGTPQYMSPEQADLDVQSIDTRSDIYSLGVVLYELLTGSTPIDSQSLREASYSRMQALIRERAVERPSTRVSRMAQGVSLSLWERAGVRVRTMASRSGGRPHPQPLSQRERGVSRQLRGDLDWIVLKALEPERDRRYSSASALADDIRRHLNHEPVLAGQPSAVYRLSKFVRRHRVGVAAAALVALAVIGGGVGTTLGMLRARDSAEQAGAVNTFMRDVLTSVHPENQGADVRLIEVLGSASATASERFAGHPQMEAEVRDLLGAVYVRLGMSRQSEQEYRKSLALWTAHAGPEDRRALNARLSVAQAMVNQDRGRDAEEFLGDILARLDRAFGAGHEKAFEGRGILAAALNARDRADEAEHLLRPALQRAAALGISERIQLRMLNTMIGTLRYKATRADASEREAAIDEYLASAREMLARGAGIEGEWFVLTARQNLADGEALRGNLAAAAEQCRTLLEETRSRLGECHPIRVSAMMTLAKVESSARNDQATADMFLRIVECLRASNSSDSIRLLAYLSDALPVLDRAGRWAEGEAFTRELIALLQATGGAHMGTYFYETYLAYFISQQRRMDEAEALFQSLLSRQAETTGPFDAARLNLCHASHLIRQGQFEQAEQRLKQVADVMGDVRNGTMGYYPDDILVEYIALYDAWGKPEKVEEYRRLRDEVLQAAAQPK